MRRRRLLLLIPFAVVAAIAITFFVLSPERDVEVHFSETGNAGNAIVERIDLARKRIDVAMYAFTSEKLAFALIRAHNRGVFVRVLLDGEFARNQFSKGDFLHQQGIKVYLDMSHFIDSINTEGLMHHKFALIDNKTLITGSFNWTASADERNDENLIIFENRPKLVSKYSGEFERIWSRAVPIKQAKKPSLPEIVIDASDLKGLRKHAGEIAKVRGKVHNVGYSKRNNTYFLNFGQSRSSFTGVIFDSAVKKFEKQKTNIRNYQQKAVELTGRIKDHPKYGLEIIIEDPAQIRLIQE
ncbi:MAG: phospholipase D family protein [Candidatus Edwardsbacteria bacterium]